MNCWQKDQACSPFKWLVAELVSAFWSYFLADWSKHWTAKGPLKGKRCSTLAAELAWTFLWWVYIISAGCSAEHFLFCLIFLFLNRMWKATRQFFIIQSRMGTSPCSDTSWSWMLSSPRTLSTTRWVRPCMDRICVHIHRQRRCQEQWEFAAVGGCMQTEVLGDLWDLNFFFSLTWKCIFQ